MIKALSLTNILIKQSVSIILSFISAFFCSNTHNANARSYARTHTLTHTDTRYVQIVDLIFRLSVMQEEGARNISNAVIYEKSHLKLNLGLA